MWACLLFQLNWFNLRSLLVSISSDIATFFVYNILYIGVIILEEIGVYSARRRKNNVFLIIILWASWTLSLKVLVEDVDDKGTRIGMRIHKQESSPQFMEKPLLSFVFLPLINLICLIQSSSLFVILRRNSDWWGYIKTYYLLYNNVRFEYIF